MIAENKEKYISFNIDVIVDMYKELAKLNKGKSSLDLSIALDSWQVAWIL